MMLQFAFYCILAVYLECSCNAILLGRMKQKDEPGSNVVRTSRFLFPNSDDDPLCKTDQGLVGHCVDVRLCYAARRAVSTGNHPIRCGWINNFIPRVCCHPDQVQHPKMVFRPFRQHRRTDYY